MRFFVLSDLHINHDDGVSTINTRIKKLCSEIRKSTSFDEPIQFAKLIFETDGVQLPDFQSNNDYNSLECQASQDYFDTLFDADKREFLLSELLGKIGDPDITANQILDKDIEIEHPSVLQKLQSAIANAVSFETAVEMLYDWIGPVNARIYSWSDNDLWQLVDECNAKNVLFPENMYRWMDLQKVFQRIIGYPQRQCMALSYAADMLRISFDKSHAHRAIYDTEVTAAILQRLKSEEYQLDLARAKQMFCKTPQRMTYSIGSICGDSLAALLERLA